MLDLATQDWTSAGMCDALDQMSQIVHAMQAILGDMTSSRKHLEKLDEVFAGEQSDVVVNRVVLVIDNFDQLAAHCKQVSGFMALSS